MTIGINGMDIYYRHDDKSVLDLIFEVNIVLAAVRLMISCLFGERAEIIALLLAGVNAVFSVIMIAMLLRRLKFYMQVNWIVLLMLLAVSYLLHRNGLEFLCNTITVLAVFTAVKHVKFGAKFLHGFMIFYLLFTVIIALLAKRFETGGGYIDVNTNTSGYIMLSGEILCLMYIRQHLKDKWKALIGICGVLFFLMAHINFSARTSLIGFAIFALYIIFKKFFDKWSPRAVWVLIFVIALAGILFTYLYAVVLFEKIGYGELFILGKDIFTGRQEIWQDIFEQLKGHYLFGIGNSLDSLLSGAHNQYLGWIMIYGVPAFVMIILLLANAASDYSKRNISKYLVGILVAYMVTCFAETGLYGTVGVMFIILMPYSVVYDRHNSFVIETRYRQRNNIAILNYKLRGRNG